MVDKLYFIEIDDNFEEVQFNQLLSLTSLERQERIKKSRFIIDKKQSLYSEFLVRYLICQKSCINNKNILFDKNEYGKPFQKVYPNFHFNISHTKNLIAVAISGKPIGIDVEQIKKTEIRVAKRFFKDNEVAYIMTKDDRQDKRFYEIWTKKEAYIKFIGKGFSIPLKSFDVLGIKLASRIITFERDGYIVSVCSDEAKKMIEVAELSEQDILGMAFMLQNGVWNFSSTSNIP